MFWFEYHHYNSRSFPTVPASTMRPLLDMLLRMKLKEYYDIVSKSRPLSAFFPTRADFFTEMHFYT